MAPTDAGRLHDSLRLPEWMGTVRFRLTVIYSTVLFGLAALVVGLIYLGLAASLDDQPVHREWTVQEVTPLPNGAVVTGPQLEGQMRTLEEVVNERALETLRDYSFASLLLLFVASLGVGWVVAGQALAPVHRITAVARDIQATDLKRRIAMRGPRDELRELADTFDQMLGRIDEAFESQRRFVHEASHELRNPLAVIKTNLDVALSDPDATAADLRETGEIVQAASDRMARLVDDLLLHARQEAPAFRMELVDVAEVVALTVSEFRAPAESRQLTLECAASPGLWVTADPVALRQALANLLANAVRLAPVRSRIRVAAGGHQGWVWMAVEDEGPGIPAAQQDMVFQRFWRGDARDGRAEGRSGLGLPIVRQIAEVHHGEVRLSSEPGRGSTFSIWLPERTVHPAESGDAFEPPPGDERAVPSARPSDGADADSERAR
jgi:signal transduction histidine kinase